MLTQGTATTGRPAPTSVTQKVLIVNGNSDVLEMLEPVLDAGNYDVVFVEASAHAYSQIKRVQPDLVILCVRMDDAAGRAVLSSGFTTGRSRLHQHSYRRSQVHDGCGRTVNGWAKSPGC